MALSKREIKKDAIQQSTDAAIGTVGHITAIVVDAVRGVTREVGSFATELFEIREASRRAEVDDAAKPPDDPTNPDD